MKPLRTRVARPLLWRAVEWSAVMTALACLFLWQWGHEWPRRRRRSDLRSHLD